MNTLIEEEFPLQKPHVYLKALQKPVNDQWQSWIG